MWNKFVALAYDSGVRRFALAICVSLLLHLWLFGGLSFSLPVSQEKNIIEARIQLPEPIVKAPEPTKSEPEVVKPKPDVAKPKVEKSAALSTKPVEPAQVEEAPSEVLPEINNPEPPAEVVETPAELPLPEPIPDEPELILPQQNLIINENAYQYVETYFDVYTKIDAPPDGKAKIVFSLGNDRHYRLNFLVQARGLAALFLPDFQQTSEGMLTDKGLQPQSYLYQLGDKSSKMRSVAFDWQAKTLELTTNKGVKVITLPPGTQDLLSFMYQFMYVVPLREMKLNITNGKKLREYDYFFEGEEEVNTDFGELNTIHIAHISDDADEKTELWLATDYRHIPVKIRKTEVDGKVYEFVANRIVTTRPNAEESLRNNDERESDPPSSDAAH